MTKNVTTLNLLGAEMHMTRSVTVGHITQVQFVKCDSVTINGIEYGGYFRIEKHASRDALHLDLQGMYRVGVVGAVGMTDGARNKMIATFKSEVFPNIELPTHEELADSIREEFEREGRSMASKLMHTAKMSQYGNERERLGYLNENDVKAALLAGFTAYMEENGVTL